ncbi:unnamed protein product, partial [Effrenium voratum]
PLLLFAARAFVGLGLTSATADARRRVAMKSILPAQVNVPFLDQPIAGSTVFLLGLICVALPLQLYLSRRQGTYGVIKSGSAQPPPPGIAGDGGAVWRRRAGCEDASPSL